MIKYIETRMSESRFFLKELNNYGNKAKSILTHIKQHLE